MGEITQKWIQHESTSQKANKDLDINGTYFKIFQLLVVICRHDGCF